MNRNKIFIISLAILIFIVIVVILASLYSYRMSPKIISVKSNQVVNGVLKLTLVNNNESGYFKKISYSKIGSKVYVYVVGTRYKFLSANDKSNTHEFEVNLKGITDVYLKGAGVKQSVYEINYE